MVNFRDPVVAGKDYLALKNVYHIMIGIYLWEYFTTFSYEFDIIRGRRPYLWSIWVYSLTRVATLMAVILSLIDLNTTTTINCQIWTTFNAIFHNLGLAAASLLIVLRVIAVWNRNKIVTAIAAGLWVTHVAVIIQGIALLRSDWSPVVLGCIIFNSDSSKLNITIGFITDTVLLLTMLTGLFRLRRDGVGTFGIGLLLWKQGVVWLLLATTAEVPQMVFMTLDLSEPLNLIFRLPSLITMSIAATRMYRFLTNFASSTTEINSNVSKLQWNQTPWNRTQVTVDTSYELNHISPTSPQAS